MSTTIKTTEFVQLKAHRDTNIIGATVSGKKVQVDTRRDLTIRSLQDVDNFKEHSPLDSLYPQNLLSKIQLAG